MSDYAIRVSGYARQKLLTMSSSNYAKASESIELLKTTPYLGRQYEPAYEAARLPFTCRVLYAGVFGLYYTVDEARQEVYLRYIEDQRMNPRGRFTGEP